MGEYSFLSRLASYGSLEMNHRLLAWTLNRPATSTLRFPWRRPVSFLQRKPMAFATARDMQTMRTTSQGRKYYDSHGDYLADAKALEDSNQPLYSAQSSLPRLPVPSLEDTCERFLPTALPLAQSAEEAESLKEAVAKFPAQAQELQRRLLQRAQENPESSWLQLWWNTLGYLQVRDPSVINVSYFFWCDDDAKLNALLTQSNLPLKSRYQPCIVRSAALLPTAIQYAQKMRTNQNQPETIGKKNPIALCSTQKKYMFHACRIPQQKQDCYRMYFPEKGEEQVMIACRGQFLAVDVQQPLSQRQWRRVLQHCIDQTTISPSALPPSIGWFTGLPRDDWAATRETLLRVGGTPMQEALEVLESSLFLLCMDVDEEIGDDRDRALQFWHGGAHQTSKQYHNRYYDKSAQVIVTQDGGLGFQGEHSMLDGMPYAPFNHTIVKDGQVEEDCLLDNDTSDNSLLPLVTNIFQQAFDSLTPEGRSEIDKCIASAKEHLQSLANDYELHSQHYWKYGANTMKQAGCSPDAYIQMAMQLATHRMMGETLATYESTQVMRFLHGRTETIRSVSPASLAFCRAMDKNQEETELRKHRLHLLQEACNSHVEYIRNAVKAEGVDRHFFGLSMCLEGAAQPPDLFSHPLFVLSKRFRLSTSCVPELAPGFGPVVPDGLGMGYEPKAEACFVHVTARKEFAWTEPMCQYLEEALDDMRSLYDLEEVPRSKL